LGFAHVILPWSGGSTALSVTESSRYEATMQQ
jgi:hypothetical protein